MPCILAISTMEHSDTYRTLARHSEAMFKEKGSKFIARAFPVSDEEEIREILETLKKEFYDARHHCYAWILGVKAERYRANDAGEPNHSAGDPILGQIRSLGLTNTLVVVVRYFGGTKLGVSGLIQAYRTAAADALAQNEMVLKIIYQPLELRFSYDQTNEVMRFLSEFEMKIEEQQFTESCYLRALVRQSKWAEARENAAEWLFNKDR